MTRWPVLVVVALLVVPVAIPIALGTPAATAEGTNASSVQPGTTVSGVLGVQGAEIEGSIEAEVFRARLEAADTPTDRARVVADAVDQAESRLATLKNRLETLRAAQANGSIGTDTYTSRVASVVANVRSLDTLVDRIRATTADLDTRTLREAGVSRDRIETLQSGIDRVVAAERSELGADGLDREFYRRIATVAEAYNDDRSAYDLGVLGSHLNGERVNLHIVTSEGDTEIVSFRTTAETRVRDLRGGPHPHATLRVRTDEATARRLLNSDTPGVAANEAFFGGAITIDGLGWYNALKWTLANIVIDLVRALVGLFGFLLSVVP